MITRVKIINNKILPDIEFKLSSKVVRVVGYNGAGKSFLLSLLSPYPDISGYGVGYPVKENQSGLLEIDMKHNGRLYTMIAEYTPNSKGTHSASCYLNMIDENGVEHALNPTGNVNTYKELIYEHLDYDRTIDLISNLNQRSCGIISATPKDRLDLFKLLIREQTKHLAKYYKAISEKHVFNVSMLKGREKEYSKMKSVDMLRDMIAREDENIRFYNISKHDTDERYSELNKELGALRFEEQSLSNYKVEELTLAASIINDTGYETVSAYMFERNSKLETVNRLKHDLNTLTEELSQCDVSSVTMSRESIEVRIKELKRAIMGYDVLIDIPNTSALNRLINKLETLYTSTENISDGLFTVLSGYDSTKSINTIIDDISAERKSLLDEKSSYSLKEMKDLSFAMYQYLPETEACNTCIFRREFDRYVELYNENKETIDRIKSIEKLVSKLDDSYELIRGVVPYISRMDDIVYTIENEIQENLQESCAPLLDRMDILTNRRKLQKIINKLTTYRDNAEYVNDLRKQLEEMNRLRANSSGSDALAKYDSIKSRIGYIKDELSLVENQLLTTFRRDVKVDVSISHMKISEISSIRSRILSINNDILSKGNALSSLDNKRKEIDLKISNASNNKVHLERDMKNTLNISDSINKLSITVNELKMIRAVLGKQIPLDILKGVTDDIRDSTNGLLTSAGIDITIDIEPNEDNITIPVTVRESITPEAKYASSGETALIGLALNSTIKSKVNYPVLKLDEIDANLDVRYAEQYLVMIDAILNATNTSQIFMISHRLTNVNLGEVLVLGDYDLSDLGDVDKNNIIKVY